MHFLPHLRQAASAVFGLVAPRVCEVCGKMLEDYEDVFCLDCLVAVPRTRTTLAGFPEISERLLRIHPNVTASAWFYYDRNDRYASIIRDAKFGGRPRLAYKLGRLYGIELKREGYPTDGACLIPVPLHWRRRLKRGYNQSTHIARGIGDELGIPVIEAFTARRNHNPQSRLGSEARRTNISPEMFKVEAEAIAPYPNPIIVDDIITTGATSAAIIEALTTAVPSLPSVRILALGKTLR